MSKDAILGLLRHALTTLGGYLAGSGMLDASQVEGAVGALVVLIGVGWSVYEKSQR